MSAPESYDAIVVGAGPAGLATSRELNRANINHVVLERGDTLGHTWTRLYDGLVLHTGKHFSALPGMLFPPSTPIFPPRADFLRYLEHYANRFQLPIRTRAEVVSVRRDGDAWIVSLRDGHSMRTGAVVIATGIVSNPYVPEFANRSDFGGRIIHSVEYKNAQPFAGERVLVVGTGNSAGEISAELAMAGARVTVAVRSGARVVPRELLGIPIQYFGVALRNVPRPWLLRTMSVIGKLFEAVKGAPPLPAPGDLPCATVPLIGFHLADAVKARRIQLATGMADFTRGGVRFLDGSEESFDTVILATGYRAALGMLSDSIPRDRCGFAARRHRVVCIDDPTLFFVGHNYDVSGGLFNIAKDARVVARLIAADRRDSSRTYTEMPQQTNGR